MRQLKFLAVFFLISYELFAQQYPFVHYTPKDGLVNSRVRKTWQDSRGRMYFMTYGGLSVYDGARFKNYTVQNGLSSDLVNDIVETGKDSILIACNTTKVNLLINGRLETLNTTDGFTPTINKFIKSDDGNLYMIADQGFFRLHQNRFEKIPLNLPGNSDAESFLFDMIEWGSYFLITPDLAMNTNTSASLYLYDKQKARVVYEEKEKIIYSFCKTNSNSILVCTGNGVEQIDTAALKQGKIKYQAPQSVYKALPSILHFMMTDRQGNLWVYSGFTVLAKIEPNGRRKDFTMLNGLGSNNFSHIFQDREGSMWISLNAPGADKLVHDNLQLHENVKGSNVHVVYTNESMDSVCFYSQDTKRLQFLDSPVGDYFIIQGRSIGSLVVDSKKGKIYFTDGKDLHLLRYQDGKFLTSKIIFSDSLSRGLGNVYLDPHGNPVVCSNPFIAVIIGDTLPYYQTLNNYTDQVTFDKKGRLWVAPRAGSLYAFSLDPSDPKNYLRLERKFESEFKNIDARSIAADDKNTIWIGTRYNGLYRVMLSDELHIRSVVRYSTGEGLSDNFVTHLTCDRDKSIWISTASGIDRINYSQQDIHIENITRSNYVYEHIYRTHISKSGIAWSNTTDGDLLQIGKNIEHPPVQPELLINEFRIGNKLMNSGEFPDKLSYKQNSLLISVAAPTYYDEKQIRYSYLLEGSGNEEWSEPSTNHVFNFINLHPGQYRLKLKAIFPAGRYPDKEIQYDFMISPPWWQTTWFRVIMSLLIVTLLIAAIRAYYRRKLMHQRVALEKQQAIEKERTRIATDIHDDLGSGLSRIRYLGEMVKLKSTQQEDIIPEIEKIATYSDEMVDSMNEIVWALNKKNDTLEALIYYTRSFAMEYLTNNRLSCTVRLLDTIPVFNIKGEIRRNIFLAVKECIHNITKHAKASEVAISFTVNNKLGIVIHDNGKGIDWNSLRPFSNGLTNIKKRMEEINGIVNYTNDNGTRVEFSIPLS